MSQPKALISPCQNLQPWVKLFCFQFHYLYVKILTRKITTDKRVIEMLHSILNAKNLTRTQSNQ